MSEIALEKITGNKYLWVRGQFEKKKNIFRQEIGLKNIEKYFKSLNKAAVEAGFDEIIESDGKSFARTGVVYQEPLFESPEFHGINFVVTGNSNYLRNCYLETFSNEKIKNPLVDIVTNARYDFGFCCTKYEWEFNLKQLTDLAKAENCIFKFKRVLAEDYWASSTIEGDVFSVLKTRERMSAEKLVSSFASVENEKITFY